MINYQWVRSFVALIEEQHFTRAANKLHMTQPGLSQHIQKLEDQLESPLIFRVGKRFELTPAGLSLFNYGKSIKNQEMDFLNSINEDAPLTGPLNIACSGTLAMLLYPIFLERQVKHRGLSIHLEAAPNGRIIDLILQDKYDVGLVTAPSHHKNLIEQNIGSQKLALILPEKLYPLNNKAPSFSQLQEIGFINHPDGHHYAEHVLRRNYPRQFRCMRDIPEKGYINQIHQILHPVSEGLGFTVLPQVVAQEFKNPEAISVVPFSKPVKETIYLVKKKYKPLPSRYNWFFKTIKDKFIE